LLGRLPLIAMALAVALPCFAQTITDGDTLKQGGVVYRLWGIAAPEASKSALMDGQQVAWPQPGCRH
jgi:endonuclease YncB( thermonuclease family)